MSDLKTGSCLCGAIQYRVTAPLRPVIACHCQQCRKTSGHHVAATSAPREAVRIDGPVTWYRSSDTAQRGFCGTCGSNLFWDGPGENLSIFAGTLDGDTGLVCQTRVCRHMHIRRDITGANRVAPNTIRPKFRREGFGQTNQAVLHRRVSTKSRLGTQ